MTHQKIKIILCCLLMMQMLSGCLGADEQCEIENFKNISIYRDTVEELYVTIYIENNAALLIENRGATDVSPNPASIDIESHDGAIWFVGIAVPTKDEVSSTWSHGGVLCTKGQGSSFTCSGKDGTKTTYLFEKDRGLQDIRVFDEQSTLVSRLEMVSESGAFAGVC